MSLAGIVNEKFHGKYDSLFASTGGYIVQKKGRWTITKNRIQEGQKLEYFSGLARAIVAEGVAEFENPREFIKKVNQEWTISVFKERNISLRETKPGENNEIHFNSKIIPYSFLSNFFPTLIYMPRNQAVSDASTVYYSSEHAYIFWKLKEINLSLAEQISHGTDPLKAKKDAKSLQERNELAYEREESEIIESMMQIVMAKFEQNPILQAKLCQTGKIILKEATEDLFWGIGNQPAVPGRNALGEILMQVRKDFIGKEFP